ncbi:hypothetical protein [Streptomyces lavendulocolor]|uniref:hypothetical protein n=1 Tax=Streptomyces lavendulocolor TaxID=67316 RepID=UPI0033D1273A
MTTGRRPVEKMAAAMAELLAACLQGAGPEPAHLFLRPGLVVRASARPGRVSTDGPPRP